jgi:hypothetical protein
LKLVSKDELRSCIGKVQEFVHHVAQKTK